MIVLPKGSIMHWETPEGVFIPTEHGRGDLSMDYEEIGHSERMANGRLRKQFVVDKRTWSCSWETIPAQDAGTLDGKRGAAAIEEFYRLNKDEFLLHIRNADPTINGTYTVTFDGFDKQYRMRGKWDFWDISLSLVEV